MSHDDLQDRITAYWNARGVSYDESVGHSLRDETEREIWLQLLRAQLPPAPAQVLDVGTGTGFLAILLSELGHEVVGVDLSTGMLALAQAKADGLARPPVFAVGDAHDPTGAPGSFDVVISRHLLWTLSDPLRALKSWQRLLRPGGVLIIIDGLWWVGTDPADSDAGEPWHAMWQSHYSTAVQAALPLMHAQSLTPAEELVRAAGFVQVSITRLAALEQFERARDPGAREPQPRFVLRSRRPITGEAAGNVARCNGTRLRRSPAEL
ncbi:class I SAM-dependent methyltransferase [Candidatus Gracilibacteria bacterium]|nr:class I SAM-dependent methyltransferase [Candidatus Gracilibacteria bacterium]